MTGRDYLLSKFHLHGNVLTTADLISDMKTAAEYRRLIVELSQRGHMILREKITPNLWKYTLLIPDKDGQLPLAI